VTEIAVAPVKFSGVLKGVATWAEPMLLTGALLTALTVTVKVLVAVSSPGLVPPLSCTVTVTVATPPLRGVKLIEPVAFGLV
jgi:hypothetical protein